jgi:hypothetical protein
MLERELILGEDSWCDYLWCMQCKRTYKYGEFREAETMSLNGAFQMCPYEDCDGDAAIDAADWMEVRQKHQEYPEIPEPGKEYPLD